MIGRTARLAWLGAVIGVCAPLVVSAQPVDELTLCLAPIPGSRALARACETLLSRDAEGVQRATVRTEALRALARLKATGVGPQTTERWVSLGPTPIVGGRAEYTRMTRPRTGRIAAIAVDPKDDRHWLIGAAGGGIWETRDAGSSWAARSDDQPGMAMGSIAFVRSNPSIVYAGTGERVFSSDAYGGIGVLKSTDGGRTWKQTGDDPKQFAGLAVSALAVHPTDPDIVVAAVTATSMMPTPIPDRGIFKTVDGGKKWIRKQPGEVSAIVAHPDDFKRQYAGIGYRSTMATNGVYRSPDAGEKWGKLDGPWTKAGTIGRVELALSPSKPDVLYVSIQDAGNNWGGLLGLWKTANAWSDVPTWTQISVAATDDGSGKLGYCGFIPDRKVKRPQCWYNHDIIVDPHDPHVLYAGGIPLWRHAGGQWEELALTNPDPNSQIHADQHRMAWAGRRLIVGNDGGLWSTTNGGRSWDQHNTGLSTVLFWGGAIAQTPGLLVLGGAQDTGTAVWRATGGEWRGLVRGDAAPAAISPTRPETHWAIEGMADGLEVWRTIDGGAVMKQVGPPDPKGTFIYHPIAQCPANHDVLLLSDLALWKTTDFFASAPGMPSWTKNDEGSLPIRAIAFAPADATCRTYVYTAYQKAPDRVLRLTSDAGQSWRNLDPGNVLPKRDPRGVAFDPRTPNVLFLVFGGYNKDKERGTHVYRTDNALADAPNWQDVSPDATMDMSLFNLPFNSIAFDPVDPSIVWFGTDLGVWRGQWDASARRMSSWIHHGPEVGLPNVTVLSIAVHAASRQPIAFTHGRGAFMLVDIAAWCGGNYLPTLGSNFAACPR